MKKIFILSVLLFSLSCVLLSGCNQSSSKNKPKPQKKASKSVSVDITDVSFDPETPTVAKGGRVTWTNNGTMDHTVTADDDSFDSKVLHPGETFSHVFKKSGSFDYRCSIHPSFMTGTIKVK